MLKNKEIPVTLIIMAVITAVSCVCYNYFPEQGVFLIIGDAVIFAALYLGGTAYRYQQIRKLSFYLRKIQKELSYIEVPDHREGELGVLKSELYKITQKLKAQSERLIKDKDYLADAISDISHQLKTPLTSMDMMVELLRDPALSPHKRREFTDQLHKQLVRIEWLVSSLLAMSKMDAGRIVFKEEPVHGMELLRRASEHLLISMELKEQTFLISGEEQAFYTGDLQWSQEALANILKNCMEHTPKGGRIQASCTDNALYTEIRITDNGEGIDEKDLPRIFERFYKGANASPFSVGIGLAMAKQIIVAQNGVIEVDSQPGEYTSFIIKFYKK